MSVKSFLRPENEEKNHCKSEEFVQSIYKKSFNTPENDLKNEI